jgi:thiol-disulfide isomerase/thioredoxin
MRAYLGILLLLCFLFFTFYRCVAPETKPLPESRVVNDEIVLILDGLYLDNKLNKYGTGGNFHTGNYLFSYTDDFLARHEYQSETYPVREIVVLKTERDFIELTFIYKGIDKVSYVFQKGDSVLFKADANGVAKPPVLLNRNAKVHDLDFEFVKREKLYPMDYPVTASSILPPPGLYGSKLENKPDEKLSRTNLEKSITDYHTSLLQKHFEEKRTEKIFLDSLYGAGLLSDYVYNFYKAKNKFSEYEIYFYQPDVSDKPISNDSLIYFSFYQSYLRKHIFYDKSIRQIPKIKGKSSIAANSMALYDSIRGLDFLTGKSRQYFLGGLIQQVVKDNKANSKIYFEKFKQDVNNIQLLKQIADKYNLSSSSEVVTLENADGQTISLDSILFLNRNKVVYLDFWASWCGPCIRALPAMRELQTEFSQQNVAFVFVSIDENKTKWLAALNKHALTESSFRVQNLYTSKFFTDIQFQEIPRYLLFDKTGKLVNASAPGPGHNTIRSQIKRYQ